MPAAVATQTQAFSGFALRAPLPTTGQPTQLDPEAAAAARRDAHVKLRWLERQTAKVVHAEPGVARYLLMLPFDAAFGMSGLVGGVALAVGALCTGIEALIVGPLPAWSTDAAQILLAGVAGVGASAGYFKVKALCRRSASSRALSPYDGDVSAVEQAAGKAEGLARYWLARRAAVVRDIAPKYDIGKRLAAVATVLDEATPEVRAELEIMADIHARVFPPAAPPLLEPAPTQVRLQLELEHIIARLEQLSPEARSLLRDEIADEVTSVLNAHPGNRWRSKRFLETFDGAPTPYTTTTVPARARSDLFHLRQFATNVLYSDANDAIDALTRGALSQDTLRARVLVSSPEIAERVAATFEREPGTRAALFEHAPDQIQVSIYNASHPPVPGFTTTAPFVGGPARTED